MFWKKKKVEQATNEKQIVYNGNKILLDKYLNECYEAKKKELDREFGFYTRDVEAKKQRIDLDYQEEVLKYKQKAADEWRTFEHDYHSTKEKRGIELAKLEAATENKTNFERLLNEKDNTISILKSMIENLSKQKDVIIK